MTTGEGSTKLTATVAPEDASDKSVSWSSSDEKVATIDEEGNVTPVSAGESTITVTTADGSFTDTCKVTVNVGPYYTKQNRATFTCKTDAFKFNEKNHVSLKLNRVDGDTLTIQVMVNGTAIKLSGDTVSYNNCSYSVDENGVSICDKVLGLVGYGSRFGIYPSADSVATISGLSIDPEPIQK